MVVVKVEMWPRGNESESYSLGTLTIALDPGTSTPTLRNYTWRITRFRDKGTWKSGRIEGHTPKTRGPWDLIFRILKGVVGYRN
jgi:hypothetical protein